MLPEIVGKKDMNDASPPSLTKNDILANAGLSSRGNNARVRAKVRVYSEMEKTRWTNFVIRADIRQDGIVFTDQRDA